MWWYVRNVGGAPWVCAKWENVCAEVKMWVHPKEGGEARECIPRMWKEAEAVLPAQCGDSLREDNRVALRETFINAHLHTEGHRHYMKFQWQDNSADVSSPSEIINPQCGCPKPSFSLWNLRRCIGHRCSLESVNLFHICCFLRWPRVQWPFFCITNLACTFLKGVIAGRVMILVVQLNTTT